MTRWEVFDPSRSYLGRPFYGRPRKALPSARLLRSGVVTLNKPARVRLGRSEGSVPVMLLYADDPTPTVGLRLADPDEVAAGAAFRVSTAGQVSIAGLLRHYGIDRHDLEPGPRPVELTDLDGNGHLGISFPVHHPTLDLTGA